jgi:phosphoglycerate dehydrogenase-like enzyme
MSPTIYIARDPNIEMLLDAASDKLQALGWTTIRGPRIVAGVLLQLTPDQRHSLLSSADIIVVSSRSRLTAEDLDGAPRLKGIVFPSIGVDAVNLGECASRGIIVGYGATPENFLAMSEATIMLMLVLLYRLPESVRLLRENGPRPAAMHARMLRGRTIGLIGLGRIGGGVAERLESWGADIIVHDPYLRPEHAPRNVRLVDREELLKSADVVSLHIPLNAETRGIIGEKEFLLMRPNAILLNTSRGGLIDEEALIRAMKNGLLAGVGLDVFETEPLPAQHPLRQLDRVILTPHILGHTTDLYEVLPDVLVENIQRIVRGELPLYTKNPEIADVWRARFQRLSGRSAKVTIPD